MNSSLGAIDSNFWSSDTPTSRQVIGLAFTLDRLPEKTKLIAALEQTATRFSRLRQVIKSSPRPHLEQDANFAIQNHLLYVEQANQLSLEENISLYFSQSLDKDLPPWRLVVFKQKASFSTSPAAGLIMSHHAMTDGLSLLRVFLHLTNSEDSFPKVPAAKILKPATGERSRLPALLRSIKQLSFEYINAPKKTALNGINSSRRQLITNQVSLKDFSQFARSSGGSLNDTYLACVAETVSRYHQKQNIPLNQMRAIMPVNLRRSNDTELGNHLTGVGVTLPAVVSNLASCVAKIRQNVRALKESGAIGAYYLLAQFTARFSGTWQRRFCEAAARRTSFICTNVPGPQKSPRLADAQVGQYYGLPALMRDHGVAFCYFSAEQTIYFSIVTDPNIVKDNKLLATCLDEVLEEIRGYSSSINRKVSNLVN